MKGGRAATVLLMRAKLEFYNNLKGRVLQAMLAGIYLE
jgi:hypothetical protein